MPEATTSRPRILTVGAYERDNFGDLLFLLVTEKYLPDADLVAAAPFASDMTDLLGRTVHAYGDVLQKESFDAIWTVGGQLGGITPDSAFRIFASGAAHREYLKAPPRRQAELIDDAAHGVPLVSPYIPAPGAFPLNAGALTVINSSGLAGVRSRQWHARQELLEVLRSTDAISVRDAESSKWLETMRIEHTLVPDVVHALGMVAPFTPEPNPDNVVVQVSTRIIRELGPHQLAHHLVQSTHLDGLRIRFLLAGTARGHDSVAAFEKVGAEIHRIAPSREWEIIEDRRPMELVDNIRRARVVVGTSLHVRIVSAAYHVPRITLSRRKPTAYAAHWDPHMPYDVDLPGFDDAIGRALEVAGRDEVLAASTRLAELADANVRSLADLVMSSAARRPEQVAHRGAERKAAYAPLLESRRAADDDAIALRTEIDSLTRELASTRRELAAAGAPDTLRRQARRIAGQAKRRVSRRD